MKALDIAEGKDKLPVMRMTIAFDAGKGEQPREMSFIVGSDGKAGEFDRFKLGYAGTIYKAQGDTLDSAYMVHSAAIKNATAYVGLTRHRGNVKMFVSRETLRIMDRTRKIFPRDQAEAAADIALALDIMATGMGRQQNRRSAASYFIDQAVMLGVDLRRVAQVATKAKPAQAYAAVSSFLEMERVNARRKSALQTLSRLFGREVKQDEGREYSEIEVAGNNSSRVASGSSATAAGRDRTSEGPHHSTGAHAGARVGARASRRMHLRNRSTPQRVRCSALSCGIFTSGAGLAQRVATRRSCYR